MVEDLTSLGWPFDTMSSRYGVVLSSRRVIVIWSPVQPENAWGQCSRKRVVYLRNASKEGCGNPALLLCGHLKTPDQVDRKS